MKRELRAVSQHRGEGAGKGKGGEKRERPLVTKAVRVVEKSPPPTAGPERGLGGGSRSRGHVTCWRTKVFIAAMRGTKRMKHRHSRNSKPLGEPHYTTP